MSKASKATPIVLISSALLSSLSGYFAPAILASSDGISRLDGVDDSSPSRSIAITRRSFQSWCK
jgi:hypothetical protein